MRTEALTHLIAKSVSAFGLPVAFAWQAAVLDSNNTKTAASVSVSSTYASKLRHLSGLNAKAPAIHIQEANCYPKLLDI